MELINVNPDSDENMCSVAEYLEVQHHRTGWTGCASWERKNLSAFDEHQTPCMEWLYRN